MKSIKLLLAASLLFSNGASAAELLKYQPGPRLIDGSQLNKMVDIVNAMQGVPGGVPTKGYFSLNTTGTSGPTPASGTVLQVVGANAAVARIEIDAFGSTPFVTTRRANGTKAAPSLITSGDQLGGFNFHGAVSATAYYGPASTIRSYATETWSGTAGGTKVVIATTPNTTQTLTEVASFGQDGSLALTSAGATSFAVGRLGSTTPAFNVDSSTASQVAGLKVTGAATGGTVAIVATDSGTDTNVILNAKGSGTIGIGTVSTGAVTITPATTVTGLLTSTAGLTTPAAVVTKSGTAVPASAGAVAAGAPITMFSGGNKIWITSDAPSFSATKGDLCINTGGSSTSTRLYINNGTTNWIAITTAS